MCRILIRPSWIAVNEKFEFAGILLLNVRQETIRYNNFGGIALCGSVPTGSRDYTGTALQRRVKARKETQPYDRTLRKLIPNSTSLLNIRQEKFGGDGKWRAVEV